MVTGIALGNDVRKGRAAVNLKRYRVRITSGAEQGRYVGSGLDRGLLLTDPEVRRNPPVNVAGYGLWMQERGAAEYPEVKASKIREDLKKLGYESELVEVHSFKQASAS